MVGDHSKQFIIKDSMIIKIDTSQLNSQQTPLFFMNDEGDFEEAPSCKEVKFQTDSIDANHGRYVSAFMDDYRCYGYHLIKEDHFLSVTPLKSLDGIEFDFTAPTLYSKIEEEVIKLDRGEKLTILVDADIEIDTQNYVLFDQEVKDLKNHKDVGELTIKLDSSGLNKSDIIINPMIYARQNYIAYLVDENDEIIKEIPVVYGYGNSVKPQLEKANIEDLYLEAHRFNPGRVRVVNKLYKEETSGQVQTFMLKSLTSSVGY